MGRGSESPWQPGRTVGDGGGILLAERPRLLDRVAARWRAKRLDRALADGVPPESEVALALRARRLTDLEHRRAIARSIDRIVDEVSRHKPRSRVRVAAYRPRVAAATDELNRLAELLAKPGPVAARGVAQAALLLADGTGPLYNPESPSSLRAAALEATRHLRPWSVRASDW